MGHPRLCDEPVPLLRWDEAGWFPPFGVSNGSYRGCQRARYAAKSSIVSVRAIPVCLPRVGLSGSVPVKG